MNPGSISSHVWHIDWERKQIISEDGEILNLHAEKDWAAQEKAKTAHEARIAEGTWESTRDKAWLDYKTQMEADEKKVIVAVLDKMVSRDNLDMETATGRTWQNWIAAQAARDEAENRFWAVKDLADMDLERQTNGG